MVVFFLFFFLLLLKKIFNPLTFIFICREWNNKSGFFFWHVSIREGTLVGRDSKASNPFVGSRIPGILLSLKNSFSRFLTWKSYLILEKTKLVVVYAKICSALNDCLTYNTKKGEQSLDIDVVSVNTCLTCSTKNDERNLGTDAVSVKKNSDTQVNVCKKIRELRGVLDVIAYLIMV